MTVPAKNSVTYKEIFTTFVLKLAPVLVVSLLFLRWLGRKLDLPQDIMFLLLMISIFFFTWLIAGDLISRLKNMKNESE